MSIQGKGNLSYKKQNVQKQNAPHTGVKNITFAHLFSNAGETTIPFDSLVTPPEWSTSGLVNPTSQSLLSAQLQVFKNNVTVTSSARGLIQKSEYIVHANRIELKNITSLVNEVFEVEVADILITGNLIVDMQRIRVEGELQDTETDFNMGYEFDVLNEEIIVFRDGIQMFRADNNDSSGATGNYYYVDTDGDGRSSLIRFFEASVGVEGILVATTGGVVDNANVSTFQQIEHLQGQLDAVIPTVAALAGVPETNFRSGPNNVDLTQFGNILLSMLNVEVPIVTDWVSYTPQWLAVGTNPSIENGTIEGNWKRVGDTLDVSITLKIGSTTTFGTNNWYFTLPNNLQIDVSKLPSGLYGSPNVYAVEGSGFAIDSNSVTNRNVFVPYYNDVEKGVLFQPTGSSSLSGAFPFTPESGDNYAFNFSIPIQGWESTETIRQKLGL